MNKTLGTTLLVSGTMIGAGMLAMPLTSAGIGFGYTVVLLIALWALLTYSALLFVEVYQTTESNAGIGTLAALYFGNIGRVVASTVMFVFLYALLAAYISGGGGILMQAVQENLGMRLFEGAAPEAVRKGFVIFFTLFFGAFVVIGTTMVDGFNRLLFFVMLAALGVLLVIMSPKVTLDNLMAMPVDYALLISASPIFFTAYGFHGSIPSLNKYLEGNVPALRKAIIGGSLITLCGYIVWQLCTHGVLTQGRFLQILRENPTLEGVVNATREITGSAYLAAAVQVFSALALITSFLGVALGLFDCIEDMLRKVFRFRANRLMLGACTFIPPVLIAFFLNFGTALSYAGQMFAFFAVILPVGLAWRARRRHPDLPYRVAGGNAALLAALLIGIGIACIPFIIAAGWLPKAVG